MSKTPEGSVLYEAHDFPIFQNRMYDTSADARACPGGESDWCRTNGRDWSLTRPFARS